LVGKSLVGKSLVGKSRVGKGWVGKGRSRPLRPKMRHGKFFGIGKFFANGKC
jgi:hypothetical protein